MSLCVCGGGGGVRVCECMPIVTPVCVCVCVHVHYDSSFTQITKQLDPWKVTSLITIAFFHAALIVTWRFPLYTETISVCSACAAVLASSQRLGVCVPICWKHAYPGLQKLSAPGLQTRGADWGSWWRGHNSASTHQPWQEAPSKTRQNRRWLHKTDSLAYLMTNSVHYLLNFFKGLCIWNSTGPKEWLIAQDSFLPSSTKNIFPFHAGPRFGSFRQAKLVMTVHCRQLCSFSSLMVQKLYKFRETVVTKGKTMTSPTGVVGFGLDGPGGFSIRLR